MAVQVLCLNYNQITNVTGTNPQILYQSPLTPVALTTIVKGIRLTNRNTSAVTVNLYLLQNKGNFAKNARWISPQGLSIAPGAIAIDDQEITMAAGDAIYGDASVANKIDFVISGIQR